MVRLVSFNKCQIDNYQLYQWVWLMWQVILTLETPNLSLPMCLVLLLCQIVPPSVISIIWFLASNHITLNQLVWSTAKHFLIRGSFIPNLGMTLVQCSLITYDIMKNSNTVLRWLRALKNTKKHRIKRQLYWLAKCLRVRHI